MKLNIDFEEWLHKICSDEQAKTDSMNKRNIPDIDLSFDNFENLVTTQVCYLILQLRSYTSWQENNRGGCRGTL